MEGHENRQKNTVGSSRIRAGWLLPHWPEAEIFRIGQKYDVVIFQKVYWPEFLKSFTGIKIFDMCDPDWLDQKPVKEVVDLCDYVSTSTEELAAFVSKITSVPVECVPDRLDLSEHTLRKEHQGRATRVAWFGYHHNQKVIDGALAALKRLGLKLTVISDVPYYPESSVQGIDDDWIKENITNIKYDYPGIYQDLVESADIVINPRIESGRFKYKSNNKSLTAWALALPVAGDSEELERFMDPEERKKEAQLRLTQVQELYDVRLSVEKYKQIIELCHQKKKNQK